jgi:hypothetical protein
MDSADWELWARVFRAGQEAASNLIPPPDAWNPVAFVLGSTLAAMAGQCETHAADARAVGR